MTKSRFMERQPSVLVIERDKVYVYICLNEKEVTEDRGEESAEPVIMYEYDYKEIIEDAGVLDIDDVKENPEKYLDYEKVTEKTDRERIAELEAMNVEMSTTLDSLLTDIIPSLMGE